MCDSDKGLNESVFLKVKCGDTVLVGEYEIVKVLTFIGCARDPDLPTPFQVANVDSGEIYWVYAEGVKVIVSQEKFNV